MLKALVLFKFSWTFKMRAQTTKMTFKKVVSDFIHSKFKNQSFYSESINKSRYHLKIF